MTNDYPLQRIHCHSCGASFDPIQEKCAYCGTHYVDAEKLRQFKEFMESLQHSSANLRGIDRENPIEYGYYQVYATHSYIPLSPQK